MNDIPYKDTVYDKALLKKKLTDSDQIDQYSQIESMMYLINSSEVLTKDILLQICGCLNLIEHLDDLLDIYEIILQRIDKTITQLFTFLT